MNARQANRYAKAALGHQVPLMQVLYVVSTVLFFGLLFTGLSPETSLLIYGVVIGLCGAFSQVNHEAAHAYTSIAEAITEAKSFASYLFKLLQIFSKNSALLLSSFPKVNLNLIFSVAQPVPAAPLAFRS
ncbi:hypothetical protein ACWWD9_02655 [Methylovorus sp. SPW-M1]